MGENSWFSLIFYDNWNTKINEVCKLEDKISLYRQNFELKREVKRLSYALSKANDRIKYLENKLENIND